MNVTLEQAIEIHAKALAYRYRHLAPDNARMKARQLLATGDVEGHLVWTQVGKIAESLLEAKASVTEKRPD